MNAGTDELQALRDRVAEYQEHEQVLIRTIAWLTGERPDLMQQASRRMRPQLHAVN